LFTKLIDISIHKLEGNSISKVLLDCTEFYIHFKVGVVNLKPHPFDEGWKDRILNPFGKEPFKKGAI